MNRKTTAILCTAAGLLTLAALASQAPKAPPSHPQPPAVVPPPAPACAGAAGLGPKQNLDFGVGTFAGALSAPRGSAGELYLALDLQAARRAATKRPPLDIAIVIDRSGSMAGEGKLSRAREAAAGIVERLGPTDRIAVVQYDDQAQVIAPETAASAAGKRVALEAIASLAPGGGTNLGAGLALGRDQLRPAADDSGGRVRRLILLSDGIANVGVTDPSALATMAEGAAAEGVHVTTIGLGLDYNEDLMEAIAERGRGQYYYVRDAAGLDAVFAGELRALEATVATGAQLELQAPCGGVEVPEVFGYATRREGGAVIVPLADLFGGDTRKVVARLSAPAGGPAGRFLRATLQFTDARDDSRHAVAIELAVDHAPVDPEVMGKVEQVRSAQAIRAAAEAYQRGDRAAALGLIRSRRGEAARHAAEYRIPAQVMAPALDPLAGYEGGMAATPSGSAGGRALVKGAKSEAWNLGKK